MPMPSGRDGYVDQLLTNFVGGYRNTALIANQIGKRLPVPRTTGLIPKLLQSYHFRDLATARRSGAKATESGFGTDLTPTYLLKRYSHAIRVLDQDRDDAAGGPFNYDTIAARLAADIVDLKREITFASNNFGASKGWTDKTVGVDFTAWDDAAASNPMLDVDKFRDEIEGKIGAEPGVLIVGKEAFTRGLKWNPALLDVIRFTQKGVLSAAQVAEILNVRILIGAAIYTTSVEGTAEGSVTYTRVFGKHALILHQPEGNDMVAPAVLQLFREKNGAERWIRRFRYDEEEYDKFEGNCEFQFKQWDTRAGISLPSCVS